MRDFEHVRRTTAESIQGRVVLGLVGACRQAWQHSWLRAGVSGLRRRLMAASIGERTRLAALAVAVAAGTNVLARLIMPPYSAPRLPITVMITIAIVGAAVAAAPGAFITAWRASRFARSQQR